MRTFYFKSVHDVTKHLFFYSNCMPLTYHKTAFLPSCLFANSFHSAILYPSSRSLLRNQKTNSFIKKLYKDRKHYATLPPPRKRKTTSESPISWTSVGVLVLFGSVLILVMKSYKKKKEDEAEAETIKSYGKPELGGDFELIDHDGNIKSNRDFVGKWVLIYFGFTNCPDICPEELEKMGNVVDIVNRTEIVPNLLPLFISIDPERDPPDAVKKYISVSTRYIFYFQKLSEISFSFC